LWFIDRQNGWIRRLGIDGFFQRLVRRVERCEGTVDPFSRVPKKFDNRLAGWFRPSKRNEARCPHDFHEPAVLQACRTAQERSLIRISSERC
jgi:hypothetical protein